MDNEFTATRRSNHVTSYVFRDLGRPKDAEKFARRSLQMTDGYERGRIFNLALLAGTLADNGNLEEAIEVAWQALQMTTQLKSARVLTYICDVAQRLAPFSADNRVQALYKAMTIRRIPLTSVK